MLSKPPLLQLLAILLAFAQTTPCWAKPNFAPLSGLGALFVSAETKKQPERKPPPCVRGSTTIPPAYATSSVEYKNSGLRSSPRKEWICRQQEKGCVEVSGGDDQILVDNFYQRELINEAVKESRLRIFRSSLVTIDLDVAGYQEIWNRSFPDPAKRPLLNREAIAKLIQDQADAKIPVRVLSAKVPTAIYSRFKPKKEMREMKQVGDVQDGVKGLMNARALGLREDGVTQTRAIDKRYILVVKQDSILQAVLSQKIQYAGFGLSPLMNADGTYQVMQCQNETRYLFQALGLIQGNQPGELAPQDLGELSINMDDCASKMELQPIKDEDFGSYALALAALQKVNPTANIELSDLIFDDRGRMAIPFDSVGPNPNLVFKGLSYYIPDDSNPADPEFATWMRPESFAAFLDTVDRYYQQCKSADPDAKCPVLQVSHAGALSTGVKIPRGRIAKDALGHADGDINPSHSEGKCLDLRIIRNDGELLPLDLRTERSKYADLENAVLFRAACSNGGSALIGQPILKNNLSDRGCDIKVLSNHSNHIHLCFEPENPKVQEVFKQTLSESWSTLPLP